MKRVNIFRFFTSAILAILISACSSDPDVVPVIPESEVVPEVEATLSSATMGTTKAISATEITVIAKSPQLFQSLSDEDAKKCISDFEVVVVDPDNLLVESMNGRYTPSKVAMVDEKGVNTLYITLDEAPIARNFTVKLNYTPKSGVDIKTSESVQEVADADPVVTEYLMSTSKLTVVTTATTVPEYKPGVVAEWTVKSTKADGSGAVTYNAPTKVSTTASVAETLSYYKNASEANYFNKFEYTDTSSVGSLADQYISSAWRFISYVTNSDTNSITSTKQDVSEKSIILDGTGAAAEGIDISTLEDGSTATVVMRSNFKSQVAYIDGTSVKFAVPVSPESDNKEYMVEKEFSLNIYPDIANLESLVKAGVYTDANKQDKMLLTTDKDYYTVVLGDIRYLSDATPTFAESWKWSQSTTKAVTLSNDATSYASLAFNELSSDESDLVEMKLAINDGRGDKVSPDPVAKFYVAKPAGVSIFTASVVDSKTILITPEEGVELPTATIEGLQSLSSTYRDGFYLTVPYKTYITSSVMDPDTFTLRSSGVGVSDDNKSIKVTFAQGVYTTDFTGDFTVTYDGCSLNVETGFLDSGYVDMTVANNNTLLRNVPVAVTNAETLDAAPNITFNVENADNSDSSNLENILKGDGDITVLLDNIDASTQFNMTLTPVITNSANTNSVLWGLNTATPSELTASTTYTFTPMTQSENNLYISAKSYRPSNGFSSTQSNLTGEFTLARTQRINFFSKNFVATDVPMYTDIAGSNQITMSSGTGSEADPFIMTIDQGEAVYIPVTAIGVSMKCALDEAYSSTTTVNNDMVNAGGFQVVYIKPNNGSEVKFSINSERQALTDTFNGESVEAVSGTLYYTVNVASAPLRIEPEYSTPTVIQILLDPGVQFSDANQTFQPSDFEVAYIAAVDGATEVDPGYTPAGYLSVSKVAVTTDSSTSASKVTITLAGGDADKMYSDETIMLSYKGSDVATNDSFGRGFASFTNTKFTELVPYYEYSMTNPSFDWNNVAFTSIYAADGEIPSINSGDFGDDDVWIYTKTNYVPKNEIITDPFTTSGETVLHCTDVAIRSTWRRLTFEPTIALIATDYRVEFDYVIASIAPSTNDVSSGNSSATPSPVSPTWFLLSSETNSPATTSTVTLQGSTPSTNAYDAAYVATWRTFSEDFTLADTDIATTTTKNRRFAMFVIGGSDLYFKNLSLSWKTIRP